MRSTILRAGLTVVAIAWSALEAQAGSVDGNPPAAVTFDGDALAVASNNSLPIPIQSQLQNVTGFGSYSASASLPNVSANATVSLTGGSAPSISGTVELSNGGNFLTRSTGEAAATLTYQFAVEGPSTPLLPLTYSIDENLSSTALAPSTFADGKLSLNVVISGPSFFSFGLTCTIGTTDCQNTLSEEHTFAAALGVNYTIMLDFLIRGDLFGSPSTDTLTLLGGLDFQIGLQEGFANADQYTFIFSPGLITPPVEVSLPASITLFASGLGAVGLRGWRRKKKLAA
jgi:hypothetical protein